MSETTKFNFIGSIALLVWASSIPFAKRCSEDLGPLTVASIQYAVSGALGLAWIAKQGGLRDLSFLKRAAFFKRAFLFLSYVVLFYVAIGSVERHQIPMVTLLNYLWPPLTMILSVVLLKQPFRPILLILGSVLVVFGLSIEIVGADLPQLLSQASEMKILLAYACITVAAFSWAFYSVLSRRWGPEAGGSAALPFILLITALAMFVFRTSSSELPNWNQSVILPMLYLSVASFIGNLCWDLGSRRGNITVLSLLADGLPWVSLTITSLYLGVTISSQAWTAAILIVAGALISRLALFRAVKPSS